MFLHQFRFTTLVVADELSWQDAFSATTSVRTVRTAYLIAGWLTVKWPFAEDGLIFIVLVSQGWCWYQSTIFFSAWATTGFAEFSTISRCGRYLYPSDGLLLLCRIRLLGLTKSRWRIFGAMLFSETVTNTASLYAPPALIGQYFHGD